MLVVVKCRVCVRSGGARVISNYNNYKNYNSVSLSRPVLELSQGRIVGERLRLENCDNISLLISLNVTVE
jgi:hypothetical protein